MADKTKWQANMRVDVSDMDHATNEYPTELQNELWVRFLQDNYSRVIEGFRVEIADQGTAPGLFTVYNGVAVDNSGQMVNNDEQLSTARSVTLNANATYYVEIEFITNESSTDGKGFWDPSFDNGTDVSGDILPDGREFSQNVATRLTHDWQISTPISTSAFSSDADPDTLKIPIAVITVAGGVITGSTVIPRTCLAQDVSAAAAKLTGFNTRNFPDAFSLTVGAGTAASETASVTSNDRENGILTLSAGLSNPHSIGDRLVSNELTPRQFLPERSDHDPIVGTSGDARQKFWQANEEVGYGLQQDPYANTGVNDLQIKSLKNYVDFLSAQIREMKWGSSRDADVGDMAPPTSFAATPRYYEYAGSLAGTRAYTVSVGDGVNSFGDFNTTQTGSAQAAIQAAIDSLPSGDGTIYIKSGTYDITTTALNITSAGNMTIVGDGRDVTTIRATDVGGTEALVINSSAKVSMRDISIITDFSGGATATHAVTGGLNTGSHWVNVFLYGFDATGGVSRARFDNCEIDSPGTVGTSALSGEFWGTTFDQCVIQSVNDVAAGRCADLTFSLVGSVQQGLIFQGCWFHTLPNNLAIIESDGTMDGVTFDNCRVTQGGASAAPFFLTSGGDQNIRINSLRLDTDSGLGDFNNCDHVWIRDSVLNFEQNNTCVEFSGGSTDININNCTFTLGTTGTTGIGMHFSSCSQVSVSDTNLLDCDIGIRLGDCSYFTFNGVLYDTPGGNLGISSVDMESGAVSVGPGVISNSTFTSIRSSSTNNSGISLVSSGVVTGLTVNDCTFSSIGSSTGSTNAYGINIDLSNQFSEVIIDSCNFTSINANTLCIGIHLGDPTNCKITNCSFDGIGNNTECNEWYGILVDDMGAVFHISNNSFELMGTTSATNPSAVIRFLSGSTYTAEELFILNNSIKSFAIQVAGTAYGIRITEDAQLMNILGNVISCDTTDEIGISVDGSTDGAPIITAVNISNNTVSGLHDVGIEVNMPDTTVLDEGRLIISGNVISECKTWGIQVSGPASENLLQNVCVSNNVISSTQNTVNAMVLTRVSAFSVNGNSIYLTSATGAHNGILFTGCNQGSCSSNHVEHAGTTGNGIDSSSGTTSNMSLSGNFVRLSAGSNTGTCMNLGNGPNCVSAGNMLSNANSGGGGFAYADSGTDDFGKAWANQEQNAGTNPTVSTICLNRRN